MSYTERQVWDLLVRAEEMPYGAAKIALVEQVIAHADALRMADAAFEARMLATNAYVYGGEPAKAFVTFSWCLSEYDRQPERHARWTHTLLWHFKYMVTGLTRFPEIPLDRTRAVLDDMERRWRAGGHSLHAVYAYRHMFGRHIGDLSAAQEWYERWVSAPRDRLSDCVGCDPSAKASWLAETGRDEEAIAIAEPVLAGRLTCQEQPQGILTALLFPYLRTGRVAEARDAHRRAYRLHRPHLADLADIADHIRFCALTGNEARGLELVERHLDWLDRAPSPYAAMWFAASAALLLRRVAETGHGDATVRRRGNREREDTDVPVETLRSELERQALELAARFDARNGTSHQSNRVRGLLAAAPIVESLPLGPAGSRSAATMVSVSTADTRAAADAVSSASASTTVTGSAATAGTVAGPAAESIEIPDTAGPDELLDLAEAAHLAEREREACALWHAVDERYPELNVLQRARRAEGAGTEAANVQQDLSAAEAHWRQAEELYAQAGDEVRRQVVRGRIGLVLCETGRSEEGLPMVESSTGYLVSAGPRPLWARAYLRLAIVLFASGRLEEALVAADRSEAEVEHSPELGLPGHVAALRAQLLARLGRLPEAAEAATKARRFYRERNLSEPLAQVSWLSGQVLANLGERDAALEAFDEALGCTTDPHLRRHMVVNRASLLAASPRAAEAIDDLAEAVAVFTAEGADAVVPEIQFQLAIAYLNAGRPLDAAEVAEEALAALDAAQDTRAYDVRDLLAVAYQRLGQPDAAIEQLSAIADELGRRNHPDQGMTLERIAELLEEDNREVAAAEKFAAAADAFAAADRLLDEVRARRRAATALMRANDESGAFAALDRADQLAEKLPADEPPAVWERAMADYFGARMLAHVGRFDEAQTRAAAAAERLRTLGALVEAVHSLTLRGEILLDAGNPAEAATVFRSALDELPKDIDGREQIAQQVANLLADALTRLGRDDDAAAVRRDHGLA